jgi:hypothetical protein
MSKQKIRNRIIEHRDVPAELIKNNPKNYRLHPTEQRDALIGVLEEVGIVDTVMLRELGDGTYELIDGHLRKDILKGQMVPATIVDLTESEADLILATHDPLTGMAKHDPEKLEELLKDLETNNPSIADLLQQLADQAGIEEEKAKSHKKTDGGSFTDPDENFRETKMIIQYTMIFDDEEQQADWFGFLRYLKDRFPEEESIGGRVASHCRSLRERDDSSETPF